MTASNVLKFMKEKDVEFVDLRFSDPITLFRLLLPLFFGEFMLNSVKKELDRHNFLSELIYQ